MTPSRREMLAGAAGVVGLAALGGCASDSRATSPDDPVGGTGGSAARPAPRTHGGRPAPTRYAYGTGSSQFGQLYRPSTTPRPGTIVLIHGGFWRSEYGLALEVGLALDLVARGYVVWNLEYRRVGDGGGWPATFDDVAAGMDLLGRLSVDTSRVVAIGHSAGGQLAAWSAGRGKLPSDAPGANPRIAVTGVVAQAGVLDLTVAAEQGIGDGAVIGLLGGGPDEKADRYRWADPIRQVPLTAPVLCVHSRDDGNVPFAQSAAYVAAATKAGGRATLTEVPGDHFALIDPTSSAWGAVVRALPALLST